MNILVLTSSLRANSNSDILAAEFARGAKESGHSVIEVSLKGKEITFCRGCLACLKKGSCVITDDANAITDIMKSVDIIVFATPVYYYGMSGQLKTMLDRANSLYTANYSFRNIYLLATAAEEEDSAVTKTELGIKGWVECYERALFISTVFAPGVDKPGAIKDHPALKKAYELGKNL